MFGLFSVRCVFFFNDTATTEIYTLSLHDALPIFPGDVLLLVDDAETLWREAPDVALMLVELWLAAAEDRKSTRLNSSHSQISYAVFCLKKKKTKHNIRCVSRGHPDQPIVQCYLKN